MALGDSIFPGPHSRVERVLPSVVCTTHPQAFGVEEARGDLQAGKARG